MFVDNLVRLAVLMPRGGGRFLRLMTKIVPSLRKYPLALHFPDGIVLNANFDNNVFYPLLRYGAYRHQMTEDFIITCMLRKGDVVVDVGANIGYVSAICAACVGESGRVYSFEPSKRTIGHIIHLSEQLPQIIPQQYAVSMSSGTVVFVDEEMSDRSHISVDDSVGYSVPSVTLDSWALDHDVNSVSFVKIDAEGSDLGVIVGAAGLIRSHEPIVEFEAFSSDAVQDIHNAITSAGPGDYLIYRVRNSYPFNLLANATFSNNYFAIPCARKDLVPELLFNMGYLAPFPEEI